MRQLRFWKPNGTWQREINEHTDAWPSWCQIFVSVIGYASQWKSRERAGTSLYPTCMPIYMWLVRGLLTTYQVGCSNWHWWICGQPVVCQDGEGWQYATGWGSRDWRASPRIMLDVVRARKWTMKYTLNFVAQAHGSWQRLMTHLVPSPIGKEDQLSHFIMDLYLVEKNHWRTGFISRW